MNDDRQQRLIEAVEQIHTQLSEIEEIVAAEEAHADAQTRDARDQLSSGDVYEVVIETPPGESGRDAVARIDGIVTFVKPGGHELEAATTAKIKITDVGDSQAHAIVSEMVD